MKQFRFAGDALDDAGNFVNRSPHPALHLLRQQSVTAAIDAQPELAEEVPQVNAERMRSIGVESMAQLLDDTALAAAARILEQRSTDTL